MVSENKNLKEGFEENEMVAVYCVKRHNLFFVAWDLMKCTGYFRIVCVVSFFIIQKNICMHPQIRNRPHKMTQRSKR